MDRNTTAAVQPTYMTATTGQSTERRIVPKKEADAGVGAGVGGGVGGGVGEDLDLEGYTNYARGSK